jgi:hypothetical protein
MKTKALPCGSIAPLKSGWNSYEPKRRSYISKHGFHRMLFNKTYLIEEFDRDSKWGKIRLISIRRNDSAPIYSWKEFWKIKNDICGKHRTAIQIFPAEADLVEAPYTYYLWVLPEDFQLPFGLHLGEQ